MPFFFLLKAAGNVSLAALGMILVMLPLFFLAMYEKDGQPLEVVAKHFIQAKFLRPKVRPYQTDKLHKCMQNTDYPENGRYSIYLLISVRPHTFRIYNKVRKIETFATNELPISNVCCCTKSVISINSGNFMLFFIEF